MFSLNLLEKNRIKNGRLFVYEKDTTDLADVYTYEGSEYVAGPNPIYCVDGIPTNTYFLKNRIYDVLAQEYVGESSDPSGDLRENSWVESFTTKIGFELDSVESTDSITTVYTINGLKQTPTGGFVKVIGYWNNNDCEERLYMWDSNAVNTEDGGLIIASDITDTGRWLLICNEIMKSEYYGVYGDNHQEHLGNLFSYNDTYGSMSLVSPKTIYLAPGSYGDGYSLYNARGKKVVFSYGASIKTGNTLRTLSYEGVNATGNVLGNIQVGFNENGQWDESRAQQPVRLSTYNTLDNFLNSWSKYLIFDKEGTITLGATKTLSGCYCVFEKDIDIISNGGSVIYFDNCTIVSDHKIVDGYATHFKNMFVSDKWFKKGAFSPDATSDTNCSARSTDFDNANDYWAMLTLYSPSAVTANFAQMNCDSLSLTGNGLSAATIQNYNGPSISIISNKLTFENCTANNVYSFANDLTVLNSKFDYGYLMGNADGGEIKRYLKNNKFGSTVNFKMENATGCYISAYGNDFGSIRPVFYSENGLDVGDRIHTDYRDNQGLGDNFNFNYTASYTSTAIVNGNTLVWNDAVGLDNWNNGFVTYKISPSKDVYWDYTMNNAATYSGVSYAADHIRNNSGYVTDLTQIKISATFSNNAWILGPKDSGWQHTIIRLGR